MIIGRRGFITGLIGLIAAPAIVRFDSIMLVRSIIRWATLDDLERMTGRQIIPVNHDMIISYGIDAQGTLTAIKSMPSDVSYVTVPFYDVTHDALGRLLSRGELIEASAFNHPSIDRARSMLSIIAEHNAETIHGKNET